VPSDFQGWELRDPWFLLVALAAPFVFWLASRRTSVLTYSSLSLLDEAPKSWRVRLAKLPALLLALASVTLSVALAGPRIGDATTRVHREGIAISIIVDRSGSMDIIDIDRDAEKNRLEVVKDVLADFVSKRPDDLIGLVAFGTFADGLCPLTLDHGNLQTVIRDLEGPRLDSERETAVGDGLALACERLRQLEVPSKIAILLTDGSSNAGIIEPDRAAQLALDLDIRVYTVGVGDPDGPYYARVTDTRTGESYLERIRRNAGQFRLDEETLRKIARMTGGRYFRATDSESLEEVYAQIDAMERTEVTEARYMEYEEKYVAWVTAAIIFIVMAGLGSETIFRRLP